MAIPAFLLSNLTTILLALPILLVFYWYLKWPKNIPPGPKGLPFVGYVPFLGAHPQDTFIKVGKQYGDLFSVYFGSQLVVILNSHAAIKEAYHDQASDFVDRPHTAVIDALAQDPADGQLKGVASAWDDRWKTLRRFMLATLRDLGMGKTVLQDRIIEEVQYLIDVFRRKNGEPVDPQLSIANSAANVICATTFGKRYDHGDPQFLTLRGHLDVVAANLGQATLLAAAPWLAYVPGYFRNLWERLIGARDAIRRTLKKEIADRKATGDSQGTNDYLDAFLEEMKMEKDSHLFTDFELMTELMNLFGAGTETTTTSLMWLFYFMIENPEVQTKIQKEIDDNIGRDRPVTVQDKTVLPYTDAAMNELQRAGNVVPLGVPRTVNHDVSLRGYTIPKGSLVFPNLWAVHRDKKIWGDPQNFRPERFLENGKIVDSPYLIPFSLGKRDCVGMALARMEVFLLMVNLLQRFRITLPQGDKLPSRNDYVTGVSVRPKSFRVCFIERS